MDDKEAIELLEQQYASIKRRTRQLQRSDHLWNDLGIDSVDAVELLVVIEELLAIEALDDPRLEPVETVGDLADLLVSLVSETAASTA